MVVGFHRNVSTLFDSSARPRKLIAELGSERTWSCNDCCELSEHERTREPRDASRDEARDGVDEVAEDRNVEARNPGLEIRLDFKLEGGSARVPRKGLETISRTTIFDNNLCRSPG